MIKRAFTLIEILIVVAVLGILAAIVVPQIQDYSQQAKESNAKANLKILREAIERYAAQHNGVAPGYDQNDPSKTASPRIFSSHLVGDGSYLLTIPRNPFNDSSALIIIPNGTDFPSEPSPNNLFGWIYKPATKTIKLNRPGTDSSGVAYFDY